MQTYAKPILGLSTIQSVRFLALFHDYGKELVQAGYTPVVARLHLRSIAHFGVWLELKGVALESIDDQTVAMFDRHRSRCRCPGTSRDSGRHVVSCLRVFLSRLRERRIVETPAPTEPSGLIREFLGWMSAQRGVADTTLTSYRRYVPFDPDGLGGAADVPALPGRGRSVPSGARASPDIASELVTAFPAAGSDLSASPAHPGGVSLDPERHP
jgi:hypothetical protein